MGGTIAAINNMNKLLLASGSASRKKLLEQSQIPFLVIGHNADEQSCDWKKSLEQLVNSIAIAKMEHALLPPGNENDIIFVLSADTLGQDSCGTIHGKPIDKEHAIFMIKALRGHGRCSTAFCLDKKKSISGSWVLQERITHVVTAQYEFDMPDDWIEHYIKTVPTYLDISGGVTIEGYGAQFLKSISGSYSTILGLPLFELRQALEQIGFF